MKATEKELRMIEEAREEMLDIVNTAFDVLIMKLNGEVATTFPPEITFPFITSTNLFIGKKPTAVMFGDERADVKSWHGVYKAIIERCNDDKDCHEKLMYLRDKVMGRERMLLSSSPDGMRRPLKVDEDMFAETHYGTGTLLYILRDKILAHTGFNCSNVGITVKS